MVHPVKSTFFKDLFLEQSQIFLLAPFCLAIGIIIYPHISIFSAYIWGLFSVVFYIYSYHKKNLSMQYIMSGLFWVILGTLAMGHKMQKATGPYLHIASSKPLWMKGVVQDIQRGPKEKKFQLRVETLEGYGTPPQKLLLNYKFKNEKVFKAGDTLKLKAMITPLKRPFLPGGYNYRHQKHIHNIGGEGYVTYIHRITPNATFSIYPVRELLTQKILYTFPGQIGAIVAALVTGDTAAIQPKTRALFVDTGIAHILAISGLHLSLVGGVFFFLFRTLGGAIPHLYRHIPAQKLAAILSLCATFFYLLLSGARVPTVRAFIGFTCMMGGILLNRPVLSLRIVAIAALITLLLFPESLASPSFQLSFAAVTGLVACYEYISQRLPLRIRRKPFLYYLYSLFVSSLIATLATLPFIMFHFGKISTYGIFVNCLMVPLLGTILMPLLIIWILIQSVPWVGSILTSVVTLFLQGCFKLLSYIKDAPGTLLYTPPVKGGYFILTSLGFFFFCILKTRWRFIGGILFFLGLLCMLLDPLPKPYLMLSNQGRTLGIYQKEYLFVSQRRRQTFLSDVWGTYLGVPREKRYRLMDKARPLQNEIKAYGKNYLIHQPNRKIWVELEEGLPPLQVDLWISTIRKTPPENTPFLGPKQLEKALFIYEDGKILSK